MLKRTSLALTLATMVAGPALAQMERTPAPDGAEVYIISPEDGATVSSPVTVRFGLSGMGVAPAGVQQEGTGHHHLMVNRELPDLSTVIPASDQSIHFGGGQTQTSLELPAGEHTLQLLVGDHNHVPHDPAIHSEQITITVE